MSELLVDAGNARVKWAVRDGRDISSVEYCGHEAGSVPDLSALTAAVEGTVTSVVVANVAGTAFEQALRAALSARRAARIWFAASSRESGGVRNAYAEAHKLGVDRWAAIVGACRRIVESATLRPFCVVDAGTALTIDAVAGDGEHLGGLILPGLALQRTSLFGSTAGIAETASNATSPLASGMPFGRSTAQALAVSGPLACAAAVDRCISQLPVEPERPALFLTGGDASTLGPWLATDFEICPNLVFEGLAILFDQENSS